MLIFDVFGERACFTRPEFQAERLTYPYITPSAARNIAQAIYWHPGVIYKIEQIEILSPIKTKTVKRRERTDIIHPKIGLNPPSKGDSRTLRTTQFLIDPYYRIHLSFSLTEEALGKHFTPGKVSSIFNRRLKNGQHYTQPYLGFRECVAEVTPVDESVTVPDTLQGKERSEIMLYDFDYDDQSDHRTPTYYMSHMKDGVVDLREVRVLR